jgi:hypothetical protein
VQKIFKQIIAFIFSTGILFIGSNALAQTQDGFVSLIDSTSFNGWNMIGNANWSVNNGVIISDVGVGFLVSTKSYKNFIIRAEFWAESTTNSGIFIRCQNSNSVIPYGFPGGNSYEVNIWDNRPEQDYSTGSIVSIAKVNPIHKAGGRWNTLEIIANGPNFEVTMNGAVTVANVQDQNFIDGKIALQSAGGMIKFRKLLIKPI